MLFHGSTRGIAMLFHSVLRISREIAIPRMLFHGCYSTLPYLKNHSFGRTHETATVLYRVGGERGWQEHTRKAYRDWFKVGGLKLVGSIDEARHTCLVVLWPKGHGPHNAISSNLPLTVLCQWNTKTVPWNSNPWNSKVEYDNRGIARVLFHGFGAIPRVLVSSALWARRRARTKREVMRSMIA